MLKIIATIVVLSSIAVGLTKHLKSTDAIFQEAAEKQAKNIAKSEWVDGINFAELSRSIAECDKSNAPCSDLRLRIRAIADGISSCTNETRLCKTLHNWLNNKEYEYMTTFQQGTNQYNLPLHPFYLNLPNEVLDIYGKKFDYRSEIFHTWLQASSGIIYTVLAILIIFIIIAYRLIKHITAISNQAIANRYHDEFKIRTIDIEKQFDRLKLELRRIPNSCILSVALPDENLTFELSTDEFASVACLIREMRTLEARLKKQEIPDIKTPPTNAPSNKSIESKIPKNTRPRRKTISHKYDPFI